MTQNAVTQIVLATVGVNDVALIVLRQGVNREIAAQ
jgi:hypothetical protein